MNMAKLKTHYILTLITAIFKEKYEVFVPFENGGQISISAKI